MWTNRRFFSTGPAQFDLAQQVLFWLNIQPELNFGLHCASNSATDPISQDLADREIVDDYMKVEKLI